MLPIRPSFLLSFLFVLPVSVQAEQISIVFLSGLAELQGTQLAQGGSDLSPIASLVKEMRQTVDGHVQISSEGLQ